jgi:hypothetical protein
VDIWPLMRVVVMIIHNSDRSIGLDSDVDSLFIE